jgi:hypothetical protein
MKSPRTRTIATIPAWKAAALPEVARGSLKPR